MVAPTCPMTRPQTLDRYFLENRAKLLDVAAFLDRLDRSPGDVSHDHRLLSMRDAIALLADGKPERTRRILELLSDPTTTPISAAGAKSATGADPAYRPRPALADDDDLNLL